ncbi:MAG: BrnA antitoxin family protein [Pseudomonadota bacterium]|nr:BrnA antitoxin family protein [Pseudomonadota bacterium]
MKGNRKDTRGTWTDPDDAPELTDEWFEKATLMQGNRVVRRGRPKLPVTKTLVSLRLDADVLEGFRATGARWQSRINQVLRRHLLHDRKE